jgi:hypothetical protein
MFRGKNYHHHHGTSLDEWNPLVLSFVILIVEIVTTSKIFLSLFFNDLIVFLSNSRIEKKKL